MKADGMKRILVLLFFVYFINSVTLNAQIIKGFAAAGLNMAQVDGDEAYGYRMPGFNAGLGIMIPFKTNFDFSMETSFNQKGAKQKAQYIAFRGDDTLTGAYWLRLNYAEIPIMVHYTDKNFITVGAGFAFGRLVGASEFEHGKQTNTTALDGTYARNDYSVVIDLKMRIHRKLWGNFRYQYSMLQIREREFFNLGGTEGWTRSQYNNLLSLRLFYIFNEDESARAVVKSQMNR